MAIEYRKAYSNTNMRLSTKILFPLLVLTAVFIVLSALILLGFVLPAFYALEHTEAMENVDRVVRAIDAEVTTLHARAMDWGFWDASYAYVQGENPDFEAENLDANALKELQADVLFIFDGEDQVCWGITEDSILGRSAVVPWIDRMATRRHILFDFPDKSDMPSEWGLWGILAGNEKPLLFAAVPILDSIRHGPRAGTLLVGTWIDEEFASRLRERTRVDFSFVTPSSVDFQAIWARLGTATLADSAEGNRLALWRRFDSVDSGGVVAQVIVPRTIVEQGTATVMFALVSTAILGVLILAVIFLVIRSVVIVPIKELEVHITAIEDKADFTVRLNVNRDDEVGALAHAFDALLATVDDSACRLQAAIVELEQLAVVDALTGIANRRRFNEALAAEWNRSRRHGAPIALLMADIDYFKGYNDRFGHQAGDTCLTMIATVLAHLARRAGDLVARYGGEEFAVILAETSADAALNIAELACARVRDRGIPFPRDSGTVVTLSVGAASLIPGEGQSSADLVALADGALYAAKRAGRDRAVLA